MNMREKNHHVSRAIVSLIMLLSGVSTAQATFIQNTFGLSDPHSTITFGEHVFPPGTAVTTQYADLGVTFSPLAYYSPIPGGFPNIDDQNITNFLPNQFPIIPLVMSFSGPQTEAAFALATADGGTTTFQAFLGGSLVESVTAATSLFSSNNFFGFRDITFDAISVSTVTPIDNALVLDNLQVPAASSSVPEPGTILLIGSGVIALVGGKKKQRKLT